MGPPTPTRTHQQHAQHESRRNFKVQKESLGLRQTKHDSTQSHAEKEERSIPSQVAMTKIHRTTISVLYTLLLISSVGANHGVFNVKCKFAGQERSLSDFKAHDYRRHLSLLTGVDLPLGGTGRPDAVGSSLNSQPFS